MWPIARSRTSPPDMIDSAAPRSSSGRNDPDLRPAGAMLRAGRSHDRAGRLDPAMSAYAEAIALAELSGERAVLVEALRRKAVIHHRRSESEPAMQFGERSYDEAVAMGDRVLAGEALNRLGGFGWPGGNIEEAKTTLRDALRVAAGDHGHPRRGSIRTWGSWPCRGKDAQGTEHYLLSPRRSKRPVTTVARRWPATGSGMVAIQRGDSAEAEATLAGARHGCPGRGRVPRRATAGSTSPRSPTRKSAVR